MRNHSTPDKIALLTGAALVLATVLFLPAADAEASVNASLVCEPGFNGALCEARPIDSSYTYQWWTSGYLSIPSPCSGPICSVSCLNRNGGTVYVKVTAPDGSSDTASKNIDCRYGAL